MKILHPLLCYYPSQAGGPANAIYWLNNSIDSHVFSAEVISTTFGLSTPICSKYYSENHKAIFLKHKGVSYIYLCVMKLKTVQIVQFSSLFFLPTLPILLLALLKNKSVIISPRGEMYQAAISQKRFRKKLWINVLKLVQTKIHFHATNDVELELIQKIFPRAKSTVMIPNYIEMPKKLNLDIKMSFVFVGRINPIKNIHLLISAISKIHKVYPNVKLDILGTARLDYEISYMNTLQVQIIENALEKVVHFRGHVDGSLKNKIIASSKALILPSKSENFGNVILEALAQGTLVIASKNTPWKLLEKYESGMWVGSNIEELTDAMLKILALDELAYQQMRKNAFVLCKSEFDVKKNIQVWENYYKQITNNV